MVALATDSSVGSRAFGTRTATLDGDRKGQLSNGKCNEKFKHLMALAQSIYQLKGR